MAESKGVAIHCDIGWNVSVYKRYNWEKGLLLRNKRETSAKRVEKERALRLTTKNLCAIGVCHRGPTSLRIVPENVKVNNEVFPKELLIPIWKEDIPRLYPGEESKVILHMDGARAHFHPNVVQWLETNKIKYIPAGHWPANSPDLSPMDYGINGIFKKF